MSDVLKRSYEARFLLLEHVANSLRSEIQDLLSDTAGVVKTSAQVASPIAFVKKANSVPSVSNPLVEFIDQVSCRIDVNSIDVVGGIEEALEQSFSIIHGEWRDSVDGSSPTRYLHCLIPPQAKPRGWEKRDDVPRAVELVIFVQSNVDLKAAPKSELEKQSEPLTDDIVIALSGGGLRATLFHLV